MPTPVELTSKQRSVLDFIRSCIRGRGYGPTVREIGEKFSINSPNGVMCHLKALERKGCIIRDPHRSRAIQLTDGATAGGLPLRGVIAAGSLHLAEETIEQIDFGDMFHDDDLFVLQVRGESMIDDHIADGDYVVIRKQDEARTGEIVVALTDDNEATLKRWYPENGRIRLEPANSTMEPIYVTNARVLGVVVGVVRKVG